MQESSGVENITIDEQPQDASISSSSNGGQVIDLTSVHGATDMEVSTVLMALGVNAALFVILIACYELFSRYMPRLYRPKDPTIESSHLHWSKSRSPLPLSWLPQMFRIPWSQVRKQCGLDSYFFLRFIRMCLQVTAVSGLWAAIVLWPVYSTGTNGAEGWYFLSMANLEQGSWKLWIPTLFMWLLTVYIVFVMNEEYKHYVECRMEFLARGDVDVDRQQRYTLMVEEIPHELRSDKALYDYFEELFPGKVHSAKIVLNVPDLQDVIAHRDKILRRLEKCIRIQEVTGKRPMHKVRKIPIRVPNVRDPTDLHDEAGRLAQPGERVDSIHYFTRYLTILNARVTELQERKVALAAQGDDSIRASEWISYTLGLAPRSASVDGSGRDDDAAVEAPPLAMRIFSLVRQLGLDFLIGGCFNLHRQLDVVVDTVGGAPMSSTGFVTFSDLVTITCAVRAPLSHEAGVLNARMAPEPRDILWKNAHINQSWSLGREWTANVLLGLGAILWSVPVAFIQALVNLESLARIPGLSGLNKLNESEYAAFINGYLPVVALLGLIMLLPIIFRWISMHYERRKSHSDVQISILNRFFYYQLANVYVTVTAGSILESLEDILDHPSYVFEILGRSVPTVVGYFVALLLTKMLAGLPIVLLRLGPLSEKLLMKLFCREKYLTQREIDRQNRSWPLHYGKEYPDQLLVILIMFAYATICPIILPVGACYFLSAMLVYKKQCLLVFQPIYESGGAMFPSACHRMLLALITGQCTLLGYTILREGFYQPMLLCLLPLYTIYMMSSFKQLYANKGSHLSLERAMELDRQPETQETAKKFDYYVYRQPELSTKEAKPTPFRSSAGRDPEQQQQDEDDNVDQYTSDLELRSIRSDDRRKEEDEESKVV